MKLTPEDVARMRKELEEWDAEQALEVPRMELPDIWTIRERFRDPSDLALERAAKLLYETSLGLALKRHPDTKVVGTICLFEELDEAAVLHWIDLVKISRTFDWRELERL